MLPFLECRRPATLRCVVRIIDVKRDWHRNRNDWRRLLWHFSDTRESDAVNSIEQLRPRCHKQPPAAVRTVAGLDGEVGALRVTQLYADWHRVPGSHHIRGRKGSDHKDLIF
jgi:hypothetical protein